MYTEILICTARARFTQISIRHIGVGIEYTRSLIATYTYHSVALSRASKFGYRINV